MANDNAAPDLPRTMAQEDQHNLDALTMRVLDLERRLTRLERSHATTQELANVLADAEMHRLTWDFTAAELSEVRRAAHAAAERVADQTRAAERAQ